MSEILKEVIVTAKFDLQLAAFIEDRTVIQSEFVRSRFALLKVAYVRSGGLPDLPDLFDKWLLEPGRHRSAGNGYHFWDTIHSFGLSGVTDDELWKILFTDRFRSGRERFVEAFNVLLEKERSSVRLGDNGVQMFFEKSSRRA